MKRRYTAEGFLLSFSLPNFYFHATTAYDILRSKGVPLGKRDFMVAAAAQSLRERTVYLLPSALGLIRAASTLLSHWYSWM